MDYSGLHSGMPRFCWNEKFSRSSCQILFHQNDWIPADSCRNQGGTDKTSSLLMFSISSPSTKSWMSSARNTVTLLDGLNLLTGMLMKTGMKVLSGYLILLQLIVFESPVWSSLLVPSALDRNRNWSSQFEKLQKTGPNCNRLVLTGLQLV